MVCPVISLRVFSIPVNLLQKLNSLNICIPHTDNVGNLIQNDPRPFKHMIKR